MSNAAREKFIGGHFSLQTRVENEFKHPNAVYFKRKFTKDSGSKLFQLVRLSKQLDSNFNSDKVHNVAATYHRFVQQPFKPPPFARFENQNTQSLDHINPLSKLRFSHRHQPCHLVDRCHRETREIQLKWQS